MVHLQHEGVRRLAAERARQDAALAETEPKPTGESRFTAANPAYVAARYDETHVVFIVATDTEARFSSSPLIRSGTHTRIAPALHPSAPLAGLQELWEPDSHSLHFFPKIIQITQPGDQWTLNVSPDLTIPVAIDRPIIAPIGCSLALGFLASVPRDQQKQFAVSRTEYFAVRRSPVESADPPVKSHIGELDSLRIPHATVKQIEQQLIDRMKQEVAAIDAALVANAETAGAVAGKSPIGSARPRLTEWLRMDQGLSRDEGKLDYDVRAFSLTPDATPRLFVRARWTLANAPVFSMTAWFKFETPGNDSFGSVAGNAISSTGTGPVLLFSDSTWSKALREGEVGVPLGERLNFQSILNEFDADHDGWAELLVHSYDASDQSSSGQSATLGLYLYTDKGLVPIKMPFNRQTQSAESCLQQ